MSRFPRWFAGLAVLVLGVIAGAGDPPPEAYRKEIRRIVERLEPGSPSACPQLLLFQSGDREILNALLVHRLKEAKEEQISTILSLLEEWWKNQNKNRLNAVDQGPESARPKPPAIVIALSWAAALAERDRKVGVPPETIREAAEILARFVGNQIPMTQWERQLQTAAAGGGKGNGPPPPPTTTETTPPFRGGNFDFGSPRPPKAGVAPGQPVQGPDPALLYRLVLREFLQTLEEERRQKEQDSIANRMLELPTSEPFETPVQSSVLFRQLVEVLELCLERKLRPEEQNRAWNLFLKGEPLTAILEALQPKASRAGFDPS